VNYRAEPLLQKLNQVVNQYQLEGEQGFARIEEIKNQVWLIILFMVLAQVTLIFLPLLKKSAFFAQSESKFTRHSGA
jgi:hypothetical protein